MEEQAGRAVRLFAGLACPAFDALDQVQGALREAALPMRPVPSRNFHITLRFLGSTASSRIDGLKTALNNSVSGRTAFRLSLAGLGAFPEPARARILWAGFRPAPALQELFETFDRELAQQGFEADRESAYIPHVTIARTVRGRICDLSNLIARYETALKADTLCVRELHLYRSDNGPEGVVYRPLHSARLSPLR